MRSLGCPRRSSPSWWRRQSVRLWRGSDGRRSSTMDGVGPATESRDCVPVAVQPVGIDAEVAIFRLREAAIGSGVLLTIFGISMALTLGMKAPLDYSV